MKSLETILMKSFSNNARFNLNLYKYFVDYIRYNKTDKDKTRILHSKMLNDQFQELQTNNKEELNNFKKLAISFDLKINEINASMMKNKEEMITNLNNIKQSNLQDKEKFNLIEENFNIKFENIKLELKTNMINKDNEIPLNNMKRRYTDYNKKEETESHEEFSSKITKIINNQEKKFEHDIQVITSTNENINHQLQNLIKNFTSYKDDLNNTIGQVKQLINVDYDYKKFSNCLDTLNYDLLIIKKELEVNRKEASNLESKFLNS